MFFDLHVKIHKFNDNLMTTSGNKCDLNHILNREDYMLKNIN